MLLKTKGLVLREVKTGEADRILSILTPEQGIISAAARGGMRPRSKLFSATGLFCYSEFELFEGRSMYRVNEAESIEVFFGIRDDVERVAMAAYIASLLQILSPAGAEGETLLRLALNSLHLMASGRMQPALLKPVFELRALSASGFMPDVLACKECGKYDGGSFRLEPHQGTLLCGACAEKQGLQTNLDASALAALRHIVLVEDDRLFSFALGEASATLLGQAAEEYALCHLDCAPKSLVFLKSIFNT